MGKYLFIYLKTANDGRPRPEEGIGNAKVNKNRDARTHTHTHTHTHKTLQTENTVEGEVIYKGGCFDKNKHVCLHRYKDGFLDSSGCPKRSILISSVRFGVVEQYRISKFRGTQGWSASNSFA